MSLSKHEAVNGFENTSAAADFDFEKPSVKAPAEVLLVSFETVISPLKLTDEELIQKIKLQISAVVDAEILTVSFFKQTLLQYKALGDLMQEVKRRNPHGQFQEWQRMNLPNINPRTLRRCKQIAANWTKLSNLPLNTSVESALDQLKVPRARSQIKEAANEAAGAAERCTKLMQELEALASNEAYSSCNPIIKSFLPSLIKFTESLRAALNAGGGAK